MEENTEYIKFKTCYNCINCKTREKKIYCKNGFFKNVNESDIRFFSPYDFDCEDWKGMD